MSAVADADTVGIVHVVDDDADLRRAIEWTLRSVGYDVQSYATASAFLEGFKPTEPCCVVVDLLLPGMTGLKLCQELTSRQNCAFLMISGHGDVSAAVQAMKCGAVDFLEKPCSRQRLLDAVHETLELARHRQQEIAEEEEATERLQTLSAREREVFDSMSAGLVTKEIAASLGISVKTVDVHRSKISQKLRIDSPSQLGHFIAMTKRRKPPRGNYHE